MQFRVAQGPREAVCWSHQGSREQWETTSGVLIVNYFSACSLADEVNHLYGYIHVVVFDEMLIFCFISNSIVLQFFIKYVCCKESKLK